MKLNCQPAKIPTTQAGQLTPQRHPLGHNRNTRHQHQQHPLLTLGTREASSPNRNHPHTSYQPTHINHPHTHTTTHLLLTRPALPTPNPNHDQISEA